jgi:hypothetical protein
MTTPDLNHNDSPEMFSITKSEMDDFMDKTVCAQNFLAEQIEQLTWRGQVQLCATSLLCELLAERVPAFSELTTTEVFLAAERQVKEGRLQRSLDQS